MMRMGRDIIAFVAMGLLAACNSKDSDISTSAKGQAEGQAQAQELTIEASNLEQGMVLRYLAPNGSEVLSATSVDAIPEASRHQVIAIDAQQATPPGGEYVADLRQGLPAKAVWQPNFRFLTQADQAPVQAKPRELPKVNQGQPEVVLFSTEGCGYCQKARRFLDKERIPYTELDVETNPKAPARLEALASKAGLGPEQLGGVPIVFVDGKAMVGWSEPEMRKLLGR